jgi:hypothetical protein
MGELASARGVPTGFAARMQTCRNRRVRQQAQVADMADFGPLASGGCDRCCRHAGPRLKMRVSRPPDNKVAYFCNNLQTMPSSEIAEKKCNIKKKFAEQIA